jgi:hypothetical protein
MVIAVFASVMVSIAALNRGMFNGMIRLGGHEQDIIKG